MYSREGAVSRSQNDLFRAPASTFKKVSAPEPDSSYSLNLLTHFI
jgi:hypothetical protein